MRIAVIGLLGCALWLGGCSISGRVTTAGGGLDAAEIKLSGPAERSTTTAPDGSYAFKQLLAWGTYTVTPTKPAHEMTPSSRRVRISGLLEHERDVDFSAQQLAPVTALVMGNATANDFPYDGAFDSISGGLEARSSRVTYLNYFVTKRALIEFDLSAVSTSVAVRSAVLHFTVIGAGHGGGGVQLNFHGYPGDGAITLADATAGNSLVASTVVSTAGAHQVDLTAFVQQLISSGSRIAGLNIRTGNEAATSNVDEHVYIRAWPSSSATFPAPNFVIQY
jgi:hypothetical protein